MIKQYFILGRNPKLSYAEISSYLKTRKSGFKEVFFEGNTLLLEISKEIDISELGGTIKSGIIEKEGPEEIVESYIISEELIPDEKFSYAIFGNTEIDIFKYKFKSEKRKSVLKHGRVKIKLQNNEKINLPKANYYLILHKNDETFYYGQINQEYSSKDIEFRDMNKPIRREHLAISPRLSKILINLSGAKENDSLLDPFCGIGGIISEALLKNINVYGYDNDPMAVQGARKNILWLNNNHKITKKSTIESKDARSISNKNFDCIATETPLGEVLRKNPNDLRAEKIIQNFERMIIPILKNLKNIKKPNAKIAITFPKIRNFSVDLEKIEKYTKLKVINGPITESREKQFINREILVFV